MTDFEREIRQTFLDEAEQILADLEASLMELEQGQTSSELINKLFRLAHNFKGSARSVGFDHLAQLAHKLEDVLTLVKNGKLEPHQGVVSVLLQTLDGLHSYSQGLRGDHAYQEDTTVCLQALIALLSQEPSAPVQAAETAGFGLFDEEPAPPAPPVPIIKRPPPDRVATAPKAAAAEDAIRVPTKKLDQLINLVGEMVVNQTIINELRQHSSVVSQQMNQELTYTMKLVSDIQDLTMSLRMVPIKPLFQKLRRAARDIAEHTGRAIAFIEIGEHVELDKSVFDRMTDPLVHMVRNAVDHGIETAEERAATGKPLEAAIRVSAQQMDDHIIISVSDDGRGLNRDKILKKAIQNGLIKADSQLTDEAIYKLIFQAGFSTKDQVTDISGRGVGMEVVEKAVTELKGQIRIESQVGQGSSFIIQLPLSLSIIGGLVVGVDESAYVVPISQLVEIIECQKYRTETSLGQGQMIDVRGEIIPLLALGSLLLRRGGSRSSGKGGPVKGPGIITSIMGRKVAFTVDHILGQQQIVLKKLGKELEGLPGILAGAILSSGEPGLVLNLQEIIPTRGDRHEVA